MDATLERQRGGAEQDLRVLTLQETARVLKVREAKVRQAIHDRELKASRIGRLWRARSHQRKQAR